MAAGLDEQTDTQAATRALLQTLRDPTAACLGGAGLSGAAWTALVATARSAHLLGTLAERLHEAGVAAPPAVARHLDGARRLAARQRLSVQWEAHALQAALGALGVPVVLLKGAAYVMSPLGLGAGRMFGDVDILVPRAALGDVESALMLAGFVSAKSDDYDQRYYRQWMHEIPPMAHLHRGTVLDVHHTILPLTSRHAPDPLAIVARATPLPELPALHVPAIEDLVIHSLVHLVHEGELAHGLRDLWDIDAMVRAHGRVPGFWDRLTDHAGGNDLAGPVAFGLQVAQRVLATPVPAPVQAALNGRGGTGWAGKGLVRHYLRALAVGPEGGAPGWRATWSRQRIYLRAHALRMPPALLVRHLAVKAWRGVRAADTEPAAER